MSDMEKAHLTDDASLKRLAMGIFLQLPTDLNEADQVLIYLRELIKWHRGTPYIWVQPEAATHEDGEESDVLIFKKRG